MTTVTPVAKDAVQCASLLSRLRSPARRAWERLGEPVDGWIAPGTWIVAGIAAAVGVVATLIAWRLGWILLYPDALSHLIISRRLIDSQNPGLFQLGTAWLPAPHVLLIPLVSIFPLYQTGLAGSILGIACLAVSAGAVWRLTSRVGLGRTGKLVAVAVLVLNPTMLYLSTTALTESVLLAALLASLAGLAGWITAMPAVSPGGLAVFAGIPTAIAVLSRYEGWAFAAMASAFVVLASWRRWRSAKYTAQLVLSYLGPSIASVAWWLGYNSTREGDPLAFIRGPYAAGVEVAQLSARGLIPTEGNLGLSISVLNWGVVNIIGLPLLVLAAAGGGVLLWKRGFTTTALLIWMSGFFYPFQLLALYLGQTYMENPASLPADSWTNTRYAFGILPLVAILCGVLTDFVIARRRAAGVALGVGITAGACVFAGWNVADGSSRMSVIQEGNFEETPKAAVEAADWLRDNYTGGLILLDDDPQGILLRLGLPLSEVTNVFNGEIFDQTLLNPEQYVEWIFANTANTSSPVWKTVSNDLSFASSFVPVFEAGTYRIFQNTDIDDGGVASNGASSGTPAS